MLHPMAVATKGVLAADSLHVLTDGGYSNAEEIVRCERDAIMVSAPIKRGAMNSEHFRPSQFIYNEASNTISVPQAGRSGHRESTAAVEPSVTGHQRAKIAC